MSTFKITKIKTTKDQEKYKQNLTWHHFTCFLFRKWNILLNVIHRDAEVKPRAKYIFIIDVNMKRWYKFLKNVGLAV